MKLLFFDTESTDLTASWGRILCGSFADAAGNVHTLRGDEPRFKGRNTVDDTKLVVAIRDELESADVIVGWNSVLHDVPLLNACLLRGGEREIQLSTKRKASHHIDLMWYASGSFLKSGSRKLDNVAKFFRVAHEKTPLDGQTWQLAATGDKVALNRVVEHCELDALVLRDLWPILSRFVKKHSVSFAELSQWSEIAEQLPSRPEPALGLPDGD